MPLSRKRLLQNVGCGALGTLLGAMSRSYVRPLDFSSQAFARLMGFPVNDLPEPKPATPARALGLGMESFSQSGEDMIVRFILGFLGINKITYLDVGANDPIDLNNTFFFYRQGHRGVLVEPNSVLCEKLRAVRPRDATLAAGIGVTAAAAADYYIMTSPAVNTFSKEEAEHQTEITKGRISVQSVIKMPLLNINDVMREHFQGAPTFLSVDTEGLDFAILKSIDYSRFRPPVICAETLVSSTTKIVREIAAFMASQGYATRGGSFVNTIFVDKSIL